MRLSLELAALTLVGAVLGGGLAWLVNTGRVSAATVGLLILVVGVPLLVASIWMVVRAAREPWDDGTNEPD